MHNISNLTLFVENSPPPFPPRLEKRFSFHAVNHCGKLQFLSLLENNFKLYGKPERWGRGGEVLPKLGMRDDVYCGTIRFTFYITITFRFLENTDRDYLQCYYQQLRYFRRNCRWYRLFVLYCLTGWNVCQGIMLKVLGEIGSFVNGIHQALRYMMFINRLSIPTKLFCRNSQLMEENRSLFY